MAAPNLLFLFTDEQRFDTLAAYGNPLIHMPNLNRLAERSTVFDRAYVTQPVCTPSRSSLLTGLWPHTNTCTENNAPLPDDVPCLPEMISRGRYATAYHGKWHLGDEIFAQHGFDEWRSIEDMYQRWYKPHRAKDARSTYTEWLDARGLIPPGRDRLGRPEAARLPEEYSKPAYLAEEACRFLRENGDQPFIHFVNFLEPHMPFFGPRDGQYDPAEIPLPANFENAPGDDQPLKTRINWRYYKAHGISGMALDSEAGWRRLIANYWGLCSLVDAYVGKILQTLEDIGQADNTIIVFTSDHGDMMGSHQLVAKCVMYEEAVRVPMLVHLPGQRSQKRVTGPISQIDLLPTLLDLMGQPIPDHLQGVSRRRLAEEGGRCDDEVIIEWNGSNNGFSNQGLKDGVPEWLEGLGTMDELNAALTDSVRTVVTPDGWKFNCSPLGEHELYNLSADPLETTNLFGPDQLDRCRQMRHRIIRCQRQTQDVVELPTL